MPGHEKGRERKSLRVWLLRCAEPAVYSRFCRASGPAGDAAAESKANDGSHGVSIIRTDGQPQRSSVRQSNVTSFVGADFQPDSCVDEGPAKTYSNPHRLFCESILQFLLLVS